MMKNIGVTEAVNTIIGKPVYFIASELLNLTLDVLMLEQNMTEKEALRIMAVSQLKGMLEKEKLNKQFGFECNSPELLAQVAKEHVVDDHLLIIGFNSKLRVVTHKNFPLDSPDLYNDIFSYLCCEPVASFAAATQEDIRGLAERLVSLGDISGIELTDYLLYRYGRVFESFRALGKL